MRGHRVGITNRFHRNKYGGLYENLGGVSRLLILEVIGYFWPNIVTYVKYYISQLSGYHDLFLSLFLIRTFLDASFLA